MSHLDPAGRRKNRVRAAAVLAIAAAAGNAYFAHTARADVIDWTGNTSITWATASNWIGTHTPPLTTDIARFDRTSYSFQPTATSGQVIDGLISGDGTTQTANIIITTSTASNRMTVNGSGIVMFAGSGNLSVGTGTTSGIRMGASQNWQNDSSSLLTVTSLSNNGNTTPYTLTLNGSGSGGTSISTITDGGTVGTVALVINTTGGFTSLSGTSTYTGGTTLTAGKLNINSAGALGGAAGSFTINGGTIDNTTAANITMTAAQPITLGGSFTAYTASGNGTTNLNLGTGAITNAGDRTITLAGTNTTLTLGGNMTNTSGANQTLTVNGAGNLLSLGGYVLSNSATNRTNTINGTGNVTITGLVTNGASTASALVYGGSGQLTLAGNNTFAGGLTVNSGIVTATTTAGVAGSSGPLGTGPVTVNSGAELRALTSAGVLNGPTTITMNAGSTLRGAGAATTNFGGNIAIAGNTTVINERTGTASPTNMTQTFGTLTIGSSTLTATSTNNQTGGVSGITFGPTTFTGNAVFNVTNNGNNTNVTNLTLGALSDNGTGYSVIKTGNGNMTLGTASAGLTAGGSIQISSGALIISNATAAGPYTIKLGDTSGNNSATLTTTAVVANDVIIQSGSIGTKTLAGATLNGNVAVNDDVVATGSVTFDDNSNVTGSGHTITNAGTGTMSFQGILGAGITSIIQDNAASSINFSRGTNLPEVTNGGFTGSLDLRRGTIALSGNWGTGAITVYVNANTTLQQPHSDTTIGGLNDGVDGGGNITSASGNADTMNLAGNGTYSFSGNIGSFSNLELNHSGIGTQAFNGTGAGSLYGTLTVGAGTVKGQGSSATATKPLGTANIALNAGTLAIEATGNSGTNVAIAAGNASITRTFTFGTDANLSFSKGSQSSLTFTFGGNTTPFVRSGTGTLIMSVSDINNFGNSGTGAERFLLVGTAPTTPNGIISGVVGQDRSSSTLDGDFMSYDATNGFTKVTPVTDFTGATSTTVVEAAGLSTGSVTVGSLKVTGGTLTITGGSTVTLGGAAGGVGIILNGGTITGGTVAASTRDLVVYTSLGNGTINSAITGSAGVSVIGPGSLTLATTNAFTGTLRINSSTVIATDNAQLGGTTSSISLTGGTLQTSGEFGLGGSGSSTRSITLAAGQTLSGGTLNVTSGNTTFTAASGKVISGSGSLTKTGAGTLILAGATNGNNTYTGGTIVSAGKLLVNNVTGSGTGTGGVSVASGATLGGNGTISGTVTTAGSTAVISPGSSPGTLTIGGLDASAGANMKFELGVADDATSDHLIITGTFTGSTASGGLVMDIGSWGFGPTGPQTGVTYTLVTFGSSTGLQDTDFAANVATGLVLDQSFGAGDGGGNNDFLLNSNNVQIQFSSVPEPTSLSIVGLGLGGLLARRRRRKAGREG